MNMEDGEEINVWRESCQFNHPSSYPSAKICKKWVEHKKKWRDTETDREGREWKQKAAKGGRQSISS